MVGGSIVSQLKNDPKIKIGNLKSKRDFLDVRDVADALVYIGKRGTSGEVYNVCSGKSISIQDYIELVGKELNIKPIISVDPNRINPNDIKDLVGDNTKIKKELGWDIIFDIDLSIKDFVKDLNM
jgi:GDP-4-dehydro-6-deoxy-D-mannose reductase